MSFLSKLLGKKRDIPDVTDEAGVVEWFLQHDDMIGDRRRRFPYRVEAAKQEILADLKDNSVTASSLQTRITEINSFYSSRLLPAAAARWERRGPLPDESRDDYAELMFLEWAVAAKLRILGYFLLKKFGIDPAGKEGAAYRTPSQVSCWSCKAPLDVTPSNSGRKVKCPKCGTRQAMPV